MGAIKTISDALAIGRFIIGIYQKMDAESKQRFIASIGEAFKQANAGGDITALEKLIKRGGA